jgi:hypothetical protein
MMARRARRKLFEWQKLITNFNDPQIFFRASFDYVCPPRQREAIKTKAGEKILRSGDDWRGRLAGFDLLPFREIQFAANRMMMKKKKKPKPNEDRFIIVFHFFQQEAVAEAEAKAGVLS